MENLPRVLGVLSGEDLSTELLRRWSESADRILAADAGADRLLTIGVKPHLVIGDLDSVSSRVLEAAAEIVEITDQNSTDCDKLLERVRIEGHRAITLIGVEGDLPDHVLAILHSAASADLDVRLAYRRGIGWIVKPSMPRYIPATPGRRLSLLELERCEGVCLQGCRWILTNASLSIGGTTGISNRTEAHEVSVTIERGMALLFMEFSPDEMPVW